MTQFSLPSLPYAYEALEPVISADIMRIHHQKHHQAYVTNLNAALEKAAHAEKAGDLETLISLQPAIRFNGGGHINHALFWENLAPKDQGGGTLPSGALLQAIEKTFGSLDAFIEKFNSKTGAIQGSGWGWLCLSKEGQPSLIIQTCANQDPLFATTAHVPLLGIDVWEHAYYLQYKNARVEYLKNIWHVINWRTVAQRYEQAVSAEKLTAK